MPRARILLIVFGMGILSSVPRLWGWVRQMRPTDRPLCKRCNVVFIDIEDLRADGLPCMGYRRNTTPNICKLGEKGIFFRRNISQSYWTLPSIISTITSTYPSAHVVLFEEQRLNPNVVTLAQVFKKLGYATYFTGEYNYYYLSEEYGGLVGYDVITRRTDLTPTDLDSYFQDSLKSVTNKQPFFLHLYSPIPHVPYLHEPGTPYIEQMKKPADFPETKEQIDALRKTYIALNYREVFTAEAIQEHAELFEHITGNEDKIYQFYQSIRIGDRLRLLSKGWSNLMDPYIDAVLRGGTAGTSYLRMLYDTVLSDVDRVVGHVIEEIERQELSDNTIIIISSPHGEEFGDHGYYSHEGGNYNELIHTPLIIYVPFVAHQVIDEVTQNIDIFPTVVDLIGTSAIPQFQGTSLVPLMTGQLPTTERFAISEFDKPSYGASIQSKQWKLILSNMWAASESSELYNLSGDPRETVNLANQQPDLVAALARRLKAILEQSSKKNYNAAPRLIPTWVDEKVRERLRKGGYF